MKKSILILASISMMVFVSCKESTQETTEKTVVIEKNDTPQPDMSTEESDGTSVSINKNGVDISSKNGDNKTEVEINKDGGAVSTKK